MTFDLATTVAFTGHRTYDGAGAAALHAAVEALYARGFRTFLSGMAVGFDIAAAEAVLACRATLPGLQLVAIVPFAGQAQRFSPADRERYARILSVADATLVLAQTYDAAVYIRRNNYLVDHCSVLVAWYDGSAGGTGYTVRRSIRFRREVVNLHHTAPQLRMADPVLF